MFRFGIDEKKITPEVGMNLPGYFNFRPSERILDELYAKACAFDDGENEFIHIVCDAVDMYYEDMNKIRRAVSDKTGLSTDNISVSVTHSHTAGPTWGWFDRYSSDESYMEYLISQATLAAVGAHEARKPARLGFSVGTLENTAFIRRYHLKDGTFSTNPPADRILRAETEPDNTFILIKIEDVNGKLVALIENFANHADSVGLNVVSADYPGEVARLVREKYGDDVFNVFINSAAGDVNHLNPFDKTTYAPEYHKTVAKKIAGKIFSETDKIETSGDVCVIPKTLYFDVKTRKPSIKNYETGKRILNGEDVSFEGYDDSQSGRYVFATAAVECGDSKVEKIRVEIKTLKLGELYFVFWPGEVFCEFAKKIRAEFPERTIAVSAQANTTFDCYIPSREGFKNGGYEPRESVPVMAEKDAGYIVADKTAELLKSY